VKGVRGRDGTDVATDSLRSDPGHGNEGPCRLREYRTHPQKNLQTSSLPSMSSTRNSPHFRHFARVTCLPQMRSWRRSEPPMRLTGTSCWSSLHVAHLRIRAVRGGPSSCSAVPLLRAAEFSYDGQADACTVANDWSLWGIATRPGPHTRPRWHRSCFVALVVDPARDTLLVDQRKRWQHRRLTAPNIRWCCSVGFDW
jgi:hypothetical protein